MSVPLPDRLRARTERFARQKNLQLATAIRLLVSERLDEVDQAEEISAAEQWQIEQAWRTWERVRDGRGRSVDRSKIDAVFQRALARRPRTS